MNDLIQVLESITFLLQQEQKNGSKMRIFDQIFWDLTTVLYMLISTTRSIIKKAHLYQSKMYLNLIQLNNPYFSHETMKNFLINRKNYQAGLAKDQYHQHQLRRLHNQNQLLILQPLSRQFRRQDSNSKNNKNPLITYQRILYPKKENQRQ